MTDVAEVLDRGIATTAELIKRREVSPVDVITTMLSRIYRLNDDLRAFTTVCAEQALNAARLAESEIGGGRYRGLLHGIPYAAKDLFYTKDVRTTCGSKVLADWVPEENATVIDRLEAAGAILVGKLAMTEFAGIGYHPSVSPPRNPWNGNHWTGQSSSGSGVAAAGMGIATLGSDTGGSLRFPASACGVVGLRPTRGRVSRHGMFPLAETLDAVGPMARYARDVALIFAAIAGEDRADPSTVRMPPPDLDEVLSPGIEGLRIGIAEAFLDRNTDIEVRDAVTASTVLLEDMGASVQPVVLPMIEEGVAAWGTVFVTESSVAHERHFPARADDLSEALRLFLEQGQAVSGADYFKSQKVRVELRRRLDYIFDGVDLIVLPTMGCLPPSLAEFPADGKIPAESAGDLLRFTAPFALTGHPAISVLCGFSRSGLPIGMQLIGGFATEPLLLKVAAAYQAATSWHLRRTPICEVIHD